MVDVKMELFWGLVLLGCIQYSSAGEDCKRGAKSRSNGCYSTCIARGAFDLIPSNDPCILDLQDTITELLEADDTYSNEVGVYQALELTGVLVLDVCGQCDVFTKFIEAFTEYEQSGKTKNLITALTNYVIRMKTHITRIVLVSKYRKFIDYSKDNQKQNCKCSNLNAAWNYIIDPCGDSYSYLLSREQSLTDRMYSSYSDRSNVVAAAVVAAGAFAGLRLCTSATGAISDFLRTVSSCQDPTATGAVALLALDAAYTAALKSLTTSYY